MKEDEEITPRERLWRIREDAESDAEKLEGAPFDGAHVAEALGNILAMIYALASTMLETLGPEES